MPYHAVVRPREEGNIGDYLADPVFGRLPFVLGHSAGLELRPQEPVRIFQAYRREGVYFSRRFHREHWDVKIPELCRQHGSSSAKAAVFYEPNIFDKQNLDEPTSFIVLARKGWQCDEALDSLRKKGNLTIWKYPSLPEISFQGKSGTRAYSSRGFYFLVRNREPPPGIFLAPVSHLLSSPKRTEETRHLRDRELPLEVDREVLRLCLQYVQFT
ncbi:hypothetical protein HYU13_06750 [Candidatus Woesearchaeota archaeon]|nr:hypothetical protein [Candidatus Woesearchaeota archaeon]